MQMLVDTQNIKAVHSVKSFSFEIDNKLDFSLHIRVPSVKSFGAEIDDKLNLSRHIRVPSVKSFGVEIDDKLNLSLHIGNICKSECNDKIKKFPKRKTFS